MRNLIMFFLMFFAMIFVLPAQESVSIKNNWSKAFLNKTSGTLEVSSVDPYLIRSQWRIISVGNAQYRIMNVGDGTFLNIEYGTIKSTFIKDGWISAKWYLSKVRGSNLYRIKSAWKSNLFLNIEKGLRCSTIEEGWRSAMWEIN